MLVWFKSGARLLLDGIGDLILLSDNPFDFHAEMWSLLTIFWNIVSLKH